MSEKIQAMTRTCTPVLGGFLIGIVAYLLFSYVPINILMFGVLLAVGAFLVSMLYQMNLDKVREERAQQNIDA